MSTVADDVTAVVVDYHADDILVECVRSLHDNDVTHLVVVENGEVGSVPPELRTHWGSFWYPRGSTWAMAAA